MKKFVRRVAIYFIIVFAIMMGNYVYNSTQLKTIPDLQSASTIVVGDSRMMTAINPAKLYNAVNLAQNSESYLISYYKLKYLFENCSGIKTVILGFSYPSFSAYLDRIFKNDIATADVFDRIYPIMSPNDFGKLDFDKQKYYQIYFKNMFVYPHKNHQKYLGGYVPLDAGIENANLESTIMRHYFDKDSNNVGISVIAGYYLDSIIQLTNQYHAKLVLVNIPLHKDYLERIPTNFIEYYDARKEILESEGVAVLDYSEVSLNDVDFKDYNHLSSSGADFISEKLRDDLLNISKKK